MDRQREAEAQRQREEEARRQAAKPVAPPPPQSPEQICADRSNFISRHQCISRYCGKPEWAKHPFCIKWQDQQKPALPGSAG